jgi:pumilio family protein 6
VKQSTFSDQRDTMTAKESVKRKGHVGDGKDSNKRLKPKEDDEKSSSAQKRQVRKDRQSQRRHADTVADAKVLWNKLRQKSNTAEETKDLMEQVMNLIRGKVNEVALQHDASRVVQAAIQFGSDEQRKELLTEICVSSGSLAELSKIQYAHFCCLKFIKYCNRDSDSIQMIIKVGYESGVS